MISIRTRRVLTHEWEWRPKFIYRFVYVCLENTLKTRKKTSGRDYVIWSPSAIKTWRTDFTHRLICININTVDYIYSLIFLSVQCFDKIKEESVLLTEFNICLADFFFNSIFFYARILLKKSIEETSACNFSKMLFYAGDQFGWQNYQLDSNLHYL